MRGRRPVEQLEQAHPAAMLRGSDNHIDDVELAGVQPTAQVRSSDANLVCVCASSVTLRHAVSSRIVRARQLLLRENERFKPFLRFFFVSLLRPWVGLRTGRD